MTALAMVAEFDDVAGWTADVIEQLGRQHAIPATCRGSASPAARRWPPTRVSASPTGSPPTRSPYG
ncbi:hypothetical protein [Actinopolymorpha pittospori]|uniref:Uncharacterized protein n=1 Tax=Actinopolymorpha pittospori TaxID=648752 RepID=A0A927N559_9ACTN|nr:hypothetical protein [Actinopolymorpha pittospori]MBE1612294.1 hypothetical protein [Actinopolymorpha pittospori]